MSKNPRRNRLQRNSKVKHHHCLPRAFLCAGNQKHISPKLTQFSLVSELLTACSPTDIIHYISTISKHLLEKSEAICCLFCSCLFGNVTWLHTNTSSQCSPLPSLKCNAERCWQGDSTRVCCSSTPIGSAQAPRAPRDWLRGPSISAGSGSSMGSDVEQKRPRLPTWIFCSKKTCHELTASMLEVYHYQAPDGLPTPPAGQVISPWPPDSTYAPVELQHTYYAIIISYLAGASRSTAQM